MALVRTLFLESHQPPTGRAIAMRTCDFHRIENGVIVETWHLEDFLSLLRQLGAFPGVASYER